MPGNSSRFRTRCCWIQLLANLPPMKDRITPLIQSKVIDEVTEEHPLEHALNNRWHQQSSEAKDPKEREPKKFPKGYLRDPDRQPAHRIERWIQDLPAEI